MITEETDGADHPHSSSMSVPVSHAADISILIVCYRSKELVLRTLEGLFAHTSGCTFDVLLTDCSQDGTERYVADRFPGVRIISTQENLGFARGNNFLAACAAGRYVLLLNPDTEIHDNAVGELFSCAQAIPEAGAWGGVTYLRNGQTDPSSRQSTPNLRRLLLAALGLARWTIGGLAADESTPREVEALSGAFMMLTADRWREFQGFDESFFMYAEELDMCYRLRQAGLPLVMTPASRVMHLVGSGAARSPNRTAAIARAKMHFLRKHRGGFIAVIGGALMWLAAMNKVIIATIIGQLSKRGRFREVRNAYVLMAFRPREWWNGFSKPQ